MTITDEQLSAYLDAELSPEELARVEAAIAGDQHLARKLRRFGSIDEAVTYALDDINRQPLPEGLLALLAARDNNVVSFPKKQPFLNRAWPVSLAASFALAVGAAGGFFAASQSQSAFEWTITPKSSVFAALEFGASAKKVAIAGGAITPVLSFRSTAGDYCREFTLDTNRKTKRAVACRGENAWQVRFAGEQGGASVENGYATAAGPTDEIFDAAVDAMIADAPLDPSAEKALIGNGWKAPQP
ncbi:MAG TPA: zf-HC2 domain-containing protein [Parvularculaceae bacterium]|nr:zf-HC2 domain-containing protein [Parvularculaceae bacterium]